MKEINIGYKKIKMFVYMSIKHVLFLIHKREYEKDLVEATKKRYKKFLGKELNLITPTLFNEKIHYLKLHDYYNNDLITKLADKYEMRSYVEAKGLSFLLNDICGLYNDCNELHWEDLPKSFALKCTFGAGKNIIVPNKFEIDEKKTKKILKHYLKYPYGYDTLEPHYIKMKRRFIVEKYLETNGVDYPVDYKIFCMNGKPKFVEICLDRKNGMKPIFLDTGWNHLGVESITCKLSLEEINDLMPESFNDMIKYSKILSKDFKFVRVDFFEYKKQPILSELTFTPGAGFSTTMNYKGQLLFGKELELQDEK